MLGTFLFFSWLTVLTGTVGFFTGRLLAHLDSAEEKEEHGLEFIESWILCPHCGQMVTVEVTKKFLTVA